MARNDPQVNFRIPAELRDRLHAAAEANGRTVTAELVHRLERSFDGSVGEAVDENRIEQSETFRRVMKRTMDRVILQLASQGLVAITDKGLQAARDIESQGE